MLLLALAVALFHFFPSTLHPRNEALDVRVIDKRVEELKDETMPRKEKEVPRKSSKQWNVIDEHDKEILHIGVERKKVIDLFNRSEASRSRLLLETRRKNAISYLLGIEKPSVDEINSIRKQLGVIQEEAKRAPSEYEEFDQWIGAKIREYDPFGVNGKKIAMIWIPDDPNTSMTAIIGNTENFEEEIYKLNNNKGDIEFRNMSAYGQRDTGHLERFKAMIK